MRTTILITFLIIAISCNYSKSPSTSQQISNMKDSVKAMTDSIAKRVSSEGPMTWLNYFENSPDFFMVNDGQLVFPNIDSAKNFVSNTLVKVYKIIALSWRNVRIVPVDPEFAVIAANYHEDATYSDGGKLSTDGYFTALAHHTAQGWKLQNVHWSSLTH